MTDENWSAFSGDSAWSERIVISISVRWFAVSPNISSASPSFELKLPVFFTYYEPLRF